jgi:CDP-4-dehydro-6-deoxyglucose reductase
VITLTIRDVVYATPRARIVQLNLDGHTFDYTAGQAVVVGAPGAERRRPYSIASAPEDARRDGWLELLVGVDADGRAGAHLPLDTGTAIDVEGPVGTFTFPENPAEHDFVFVAGGTGIAPLRAMMRHALATPSTHRVGLLYSARTPDEFAYERELKELAASGTIELCQTVTRAAETDWAGNRGRIDRTALGTLVHDDRTLCFVCGPAAMVDEIPRLLLEMGVPRERIRIEEW